MPLPLVESLKIEESYTWHKADWLPASPHDTQIVATHDPDLLLSMLLEITPKQFCGIVPDCEALLNHCQR